MEKFAKKRPYLFWSTNNFKNLSAAVVLENTLNYGDFDDVKEVLGLIGLKKAALIFKKQTASRRSNYRPEIANYFKLYFNKYAR